MASIFWSRKPGVIFQFGNDAARTKRKKGFFNFPHDEKPREIINQVESFPGKEGFS